MNTLTKDQLENYELSHWKAGNGYFMCEDIDKDYCRVTEHTAQSKHEGEFGSRAFLASKSGLSVFRKPSENDKNVMVDVPIHDEIIEPLMQLRADIKSGKLAVFSSHIMPAEDAARLRKEFESK